MLLGMPVCQIGKILNENQTVIMGATRQDNNKFYNSLLVIKKNNINFFDKKILVPFGEFIPFRDYFEFIEPIAGTVDFSRGEQERLLSINDLESIAQDDGYVLYIAGSYSSIEDALIRSDVLESQGFDDIYFLVDNNGSISEYKPPSPPKILEESEIDTSAVVPEEVVESPVVVVVDTAVTYRVQIGAYEVVLSKEIFNGISNVIHMKDKDGFIKYMTGSFSDKKEAIDYMFQMRARGFEDAFVVAYQNGQRTIEYFAPLKNKNTSNSTQSSVNIEANQNGQLGSLLRQNLLRDPDYYILKYTGRPMTCTEICDSLKKILEDKAEKTQVLTYGA